MNAFPPIHPRPTSSRLALLSALLLALLGLTLALPANALAAQTRQVSGTFVTQIQPPTACPPPSTLCAVGVATGDIEGETRVVITESQIVFDPDGTPFSAYTGTISIAGPEGELSGTVQGRVRLTDGQLRSTVTFTSGTRRYSKTTGVLAVEGVINLATGEEVDSYTGTLVKN